MQNALDEDEGEGSKKSREKIPDLAFNHLFPSSSPIKRA
jgi:hypothetical protein